MSVTRKKCVKMKDSQLMILLLIKVGRNVIKCNTSHASQWVRKTNKPPFLKGDTSNRSVFNFTAVTMYNNWKIYICNLVIYWMSFFANWHSGVFKGWICPNILQKNSSPGLLSSSSEIWPLFNSQLHTPKSDLPYRP